MPRHHRPQPPAPAPIPAPPPAPLGGRLRGVNLCGMEGAAPIAAVGPNAGSEYPVFSTKLVDYFLSKKATAIRFLFSWERVQAELYGSVPGNGAGFGDYFRNARRVIDYATAAGITVILVPWQAGLSGDTGGLTWRGRPLGSVVDLYAFADFWGKLAAIFKDNARVQYGLVNEPNNMSTMTCFTIHQKCIDYIRAANAKTMIHVPGNGWTGAGSWTQDWYDTASIKRSNAYAWLNANGPGIPLWDPLNNLCAEVHVYADPSASGGTTQIATSTILRDRLKVVVDEARAHKYRVFIGEVGLHALAPGATECWRNGVDYINANPDVILGFTWWGAGDPEWWRDEAANGGGHFSASPTSKATYTGDTVNMKMIAGSF